MDDGRDVETRTPERVEREHVLTDLYDLVTDILTTYLWGLGRERPTPGKKGPRISRVILI